MKKLKYSSWFLEILIRTFFVLFLLYEVPVLLNRMFEDQVLTLMPVNFFTLKGLQYFVFLYFLNFLFSLVRKKISKKSYIFLFVPLYGLFFFFVRDLLTLHVMILLTFIMWFFDSWNSFSLFWYLPPAIFLVMGFFLNQFLGEWIAIVVFFLTFILQLLHFFIENYGKALIYGKSTVHFAQSSFWKVSRRYFVRIIAFPIIFGIFGLTFYTIAQPTTHFEGFSFKQPEMKYQNNLENFQEEQQPGNMQQVFKQLDPMGPKKSPFKPYWEFLEKVVMVIVPIVGLYFVLKFLKNGFIESFRELFTRRKKVIEVVNEEGEIVTTLERTRQSPKKSDTNYWHQKIRALYQNEIKKKNPNQEKNTPKIQVSYLDLAPETQVNIVESYEKTRYGENREMSKEDYEEFKRNIEEKK